MDGWNASERLREGTFFQKMKAHNPYSQSANPLSWLGWWNGFNSDPNRTISQFEKDEYGPTYWKAFYRGQGAQIVKNLP